MKAVAYSIKPFEREFLAIANQKKHEITLISNSLGPDTVIYAKGKEAVIVFPSDDVSADVIDELAKIGIKYILTRSTGTDHIDKTAAEKQHIQVFNIAAYSPQAIAEHAVALALSLNRQIVRANRDSEHFDFRNDPLIGFNFSGKTVGLIGLGHIGLAVAKIYHGLGCIVIAYDPFFLKNTKDIANVSLDVLFKTADIISLHLPLTKASKYLINENTLAQMKDGVMLINTSRGGLINTIDLLAALESGKVGYVGLDVYEHEKGLFFEDHEYDIVKDPLLGKLMKQENVIVTPHQAYLTKEALQEIADLTIKNLDACKLLKNNTIPI